jgi:hypothetical protein
MLVRRLVSSLERRSRSGHENSKQIVWKCVALEIFGEDSNKLNFIQEEIKRGMNSGNAYYHLVQNLLSWRLVSKNVKFRIHKTIMLPVVLYGCGTCSLSLGEEQRLRVFESRVLRRIYRPNRDEVTGGWEKTV